MNPGSERNDGVDSKDRDLNQAGKAEHKKPIIWWFIVGIFAVMLLAVTIALIVVALRKPETTENEPKSLQEKRGKEVCITNECVRLANNLLTSIDDTKDPCEDFHSFACGKFVYHNQIAINRGKNDWSSKILNKLIHELRDILDQPVKVDDPEGISMARTFYKSCISEDISISNLEKFRFEQIQKILGDWPEKVGNWKPPATYSWEDQVVKLLKIGIYSGLFVGADPDFENPTRNVIGIGAPLVGSKILMTIYPMTKPKPISKNSTVDERNVALLRRRMAKVSFDINSLQRMSIAEVKSQFKQINWDIIFSIFPKEVNVTDADIVMIASPKQLEHILNVITGTNRRDVQNYMFESALLRFPKVINLFSFFSSFKWKFCTRESARLFQSIVSHEYVNTHLNTEQIAEAKNLSKEIKNILTEKIKDADWLDDVDRQRALEKAAQMQFAVGQPDEYFNEDWCIEDYKQLDIEADDYFNNTQKVEAMLELRKFTKLHKPYRRNEWGMSPLEVNAQYSTKNIFFLPASILVFPLMSSKVPAYLNYGSLGSIIGHEICHGFDSPEPKWTNTTSENFNILQTCFENQFNSTTDIVTGHSLNGRLKLSENIADTGGLKLTHTAFMKWFSQHPSVPSLPHFHKYTPEQMFFLSFAKTWCEKFTLDERLHQMKKDVHALGRYRINFPLKNLREFGDAFNCSKTAKMRPQNRCELW